MGGLAATIVLSQNLLSLTQDAHLIAADLSWTMSGSEATKGPFTVGLCHSDLTAAEIAEALDASPANDSDIIALERNRRPVRNTGVLQSPAVDGEGVTLKDGLLVRTKLGFGVSNDKEVSFFVRNQGAAASTVDTLLNVSGRIYAVWQ